MRVFQVPTETELMAHTHTKNVNTIGSAHACAAGLLSYGAFRAGKPIVVAAEVGAPYGPRGPQISCLVIQLINSVLICLCSDCPSLGLGCAGG